MYNTCILNNSPSGSENFVSNSPIKELIVMYDLSKTCPILSKIKFNSLSLLFLVADSTPVVVVVVVSANINEKN